LKERETKENVKTDAQILEEKIASAPNASSYNRTTLDMLVRPNIELFDLKNPRL